ncbi:TRL-like family protein [Leptospira ryugenii]|uniref:TRL-like family protein n=1 Tax=Leptospira ryugenii TaxID=1917863 RepID=A0A2P2E3D4_9LEPT|nr:TRL-like family protein [Leptospira ryugenii]GBF51369.1 TRL-like family protein [Leptospira ryugenii]
MIRIGFSLLCIFLFRCISVQNGFPSNTILYNKGIDGVYAKSASSKDNFRVGESCIQSYLGLVSFGDGSAELAKNRAGIKEITSIQRSLKTQFLILQEYCTQVYGL